MLKNISVILVEPKGPLNIGMTARAMKNCGITRLKIVNPPKFQKADLHKMACFAKDIVDNAEIFPTLKAALDDETCAVGLTRRVSKDRTPYFELEKIAPKLIQRAKKGRLALVFGRETDGMTNNELRRCDYVVYIRANEPDGSFNLAQAVLLTCYEIFKRGTGTFKKGDCPLLSHFAEKSEINSMLADFEKLMFEIGYNDEDKGKLRRKIVQVFKDIVGRSGLRPKDIGMFHGIFGQVRKSLSKIDH